MFGGSDIFINFAFKMLVKDQKNIWIIRKLP